MFHPHSMGLKMTGMIILRKLVVAVNAKPVHILFRDSVEFKQEMKQVVG
jgi:hypothetical protein